MTTGNGWPGAAIPSCATNSFRRWKIPAVPAPETGWTPCHLVFRIQGKICGLAPDYLKNHSRGEYVFDWSWAEAYQRYQLPYYPKLLIAIPFTPSQGPRLLLDASLRAQLTPALLDQLLGNLTQQLGAHSWHLLFPDAPDQALLGHDQELHRTGCQFHWHNRGYQNFEGFLAALTSRKRKIHPQGTPASGGSGDYLSHLPRPGYLRPGAVGVFVFYQATYLKRGQAPYLNQAFFELLREHLPEHLHIIMAVRHGEMIAGALFMAGGKLPLRPLLGCLEEYDHLHFEACHYRGIELALELGGSSTSTPAPRASTNWCGASNR